MRSKHSYTYIPTYIATAINNYIITTLKTALNGCKTGISDSLDVYVQAQGM